MKQFFSVFVVAGLLSSLACAEAPLHARIDQLIAADLTGAPAARADDAEFLRRVHLDLAGSIPTAEATRQFLADKNPNKRRRQIDRLLAAPTYATRMSSLFHLILMERRGDNDEWLAYLRTCFEQNRPWDQMVRDILHPNSAEAARRGAAFFYTRRLEKSGQNPTDFPGLTRDVGRLFLGVDLQCAECHDHLFIDDYKQREFQGLFAVYQNISIRKEAFPAINEKAMTEKLEFISVFSSAKEQTGPRIPFGNEFAIPAIATTSETTGQQSPKPDPNAPPAFSALQQIASNLPTANNPLFCQNIANRVWFLMMGRGLVEPLDQFHSANNATHPELLQLLAEQFADHAFDLKWLIRELALSETYQRSSRIASTSDLPSRQSYRIAQQRRLTAEQMYSSVLTATGNLARLTPNATEKTKPAESVNDDPVADAKALQAAFVTAFASEPKQPAIDYKPSVKQALFFLNDAQLLALLDPQQGNLIERLCQTADDQVADVMYLSIFSRFPQPSERQTIEGHLEKHATRRTQALQELTWAMLTSLEFCVNH